MGSVPASTGACIVRVERRGSGLRFSVLATPDALTRRAQRCLESTKLADAVDAVEGFLIDFARAGDRPSGDVM